MTGEMRKMVSRVGPIEPGQRLAVTSAFKTARQQTINHSTPSISVQGVPGEYDHRKFLTAPFSGMVPVQTGAAGGPVVGTLAVSTNPLQWRDYNPGFYDGMFAPSGEKDSRPYYYTDLTVTPSTPPTFTPDPVAPSRAVITERTSARDFSVNIIQDKGRSF